MAIQTTNLDLVPEPPKPPRKKRSRRWMIWLVPIVLAAAGGAYLGYLYGQRHGEATAASVQSQLDHLNKQQEALQRADDNGLVKIPEWGVQFTAGRSLRDLIYVISPTKDGAVAHFSTLSLMTADLASLGTNQSASRLQCSPYGDPLAILVRSKTLEGLMVTPTPANARKIGDYYYMGQHTQSACSSDPTVQALETKQASDLTNSFISVQALK